MLEVVALCVVGRSYLQRNVVTLTSIDHTHTVPVGKGLPRGGGSQVPVYRL